MKIVHTRKRVFDKDYAFTNKMSLLVWVLSILKWKEYGNEVVLYTDTPTLEDIQRFKFAYLYDKINISLLEDEHICENLDFYCYWAMPKLLALRHEVVNLGNDVVIADQDVVPMQDVSRLWKNADVTVWSNKEFSELKTVYPDLRNLSLPKDYTLPKWFTGTAKPLNTGVIHIRNKAIADLYTKEAIKMAKNNHNEHDNTNCQTMCNAEQSMLGEIVRSKNLSYSTMQPINEGLFNKNGFHTHGYKNVVTNTTGLDWHLTLLLMIKKLDSNAFENLLDNELFKEEREYFESFAPITPVKELRKYNI